jgi:ABC-type cobalamin/Fe3+-siderophores transport system ATPase subunit
MATTTQPDAARGTNARSTDVTVEGVGKTFASARGAVEALRDVNLRVEAGQFAAFVGASGCGKSTLLRVLAGIHPASVGEVRLGGDAVTEPRRDVGMVFHRPTSCRGAQSSATSSCRWKSVDDQGPAPPSALIASCVSWDSTSSGTSSRASSQAECNSAPGSCGRSCTIRLCC